jgi:hypothetical protein
MKQGIVRACLLPALLSAALLAGACGDDDTRARTDREEAGTPEPTTSPEPRTQAQDGELVRGTGYSFTAPDGWRDVSQRFEGSAVRIDSAYAAPTATDGFATNVNVIRETPQNLEPRAFDEVVEVLYEQIAPSAVEGTLTKIRKSRLDGAAARVWLYSSKRKTGRIRVAQVAVLKGNAVYTITFSAHPKSGRSEDDLKLILDTWRWSG